MIMWWTQHNSTYNDEEKNWWDSDRPPGKAGGRGEAGSKTEGHLSCILKD